MPQVAIGHDQRSLLTASTIHGFLASESLSCISPGFMASC
jgi:hypothetical protein